MIYIGSDILSSTFDLTPLQRRSSQGWRYNKHTCREVTEGGWKFLELTERREVGSGNFQPPEAGFILTCSSTQNVQF
jgi:hypothetical protein